MRGREQLGAQIAQRRQALVCISSTPHLPQAQHRLDVARDVEDVLHRAGGPKRIREAASHDPAITAGNTIPFTGFFRRNELQHRVARWHADDAAQFVGTKCFQGCAKLAAQVCNLNGPDQAAITPAAIDRHLLSKGDEVFTGRQLVDHALGRVDRFHDDDPEEDGVWRGNGLRSLRTQRG